jgi:hypothetical protein
VQTSFQVHHVHALNNLDAIEADARRGLNPQLSLETIKEYQDLRRRIEGEPRKKWKVITLVREPVARSVAWFFHSLAEIAPGWHQGWLTGTLSAGSLQELFLNTQPVYHEAPETWFDGQLLPVFGIDIYAEPFPRDLGYRIYDDSPRASLLLIRLEDLTARGPIAISKFLGLKDFKLINANMGDDKDYADAYRAFRRLPLPRTYVDRMYGTRFARHFYTEQEIEKFTRRWTGLNAS